MKKELEAMKTTVLQLIKDIVEKKRGVKIEGKGDYATIVYFVLVEGEVFEVMDQRGHIGGARITDIKYKGIEQLCEIMDKLETL